MLLDGSLKVLNSLSLLFLFPFLALHLRLYPLELLGKFLSLRPIVLLHVHLSLNLLHLLSKPLSLVLLLPYLVLQVCVLHYQHLQFLSLLLQLQLEADLVL